MQLGSETSKSLDDEDRDFLTRLFSFYMTRDHLLSSDPFAAKARAFDTLSPNVDEQKSVYMEGSNLRFRLTPRYGIAP